MQTQDGFSPFSNYPQVQPNGAVAPNSSLPPGASYSGEPGQITYATPPAGVNPPSAPPPGMSWAYDPSTGGFNPVPRFPGGVTTPAPSTTPTGPSWSTDPQYASMPDWLKNIYTQTGLTPAGRGTGFADWQYWAGVGDSQANRLLADIQGTGTDQPTGTPGSGPWSNSGRGVATAAPTSAATASGSLSPFSVSAFQATPGTATAGAPGGADASALFDFLMGRAKGTITDASMPNLNVSPNDPVVKAQSDAFAAQDQLARKNYLSDLAEKRGANASVDAETRATAEKVGQDTGAFTAQAMATELQARRQEIAQALSGAAGMLTSEQQLRLQEELAQLDAALNESQFGRNLAEQAYQFDTTNYNNTFGA